MKQSERAGIMRIVSDLIKADAIIDTREIEFLDTMRLKYTIKKDDEISASSLTLSDAINILKDSEEDMKSCLISDLFNVAMSDGFCAREEALIIVAMTACLTDCLGCDTRMFSLDTTNINIDPSQILYIENRYDSNINCQIKSQYREIVSEVRLAGFNFVYIPKIAEHYSSIDDSEMLKITEFLYPGTSEERLKMINQQIKNLSTEEFCKDLLGSKLDIKDLEYIEPSLMMKIGDSHVNNRIIANFLVIEFNRDVLEIIRSVIDLFSKFYQTLRLNYIKEEKGRFIYTGFYKQIFDLFMLRKGIKSSVVIDVYRDGIRFPEADAKVEKLHRREKALYALFLLESASGGINFSKPDSPKQLERYERRMSAIQTKYKIIYKKFGGDPSKAPNLSIPEIRLPMLALIKKQIKLLSEVLYHADDYAIKRNVFGNYSVSISSDLCCCCGPNKTDIIRLQDSEEWQSISAL